MGDQGDLVDPVDVGQRECGRGAGVGGQQEVDEVGVGRVDRLQLGGRFLGGDEGDSRRLLVLDDPLGAGEAQAIVAVAGGLGGAQVIHVQGGHAAVVELEQRTG